MLIATGFALRSHTVLHVSSSFESTTRQAANSRRKPPIGEELRHTSAIVRLGEGSANGRSTIFSVTGIGGLTANSGISVTPVLAATIWRRVSMLVAWKSTRSWAPDSAQTSSACSRRQCPSRGRL